MVMIDIKDNGGEGGFITFLQPVEFLQLIWKCKLLPHILSPVTDALPKTSVETISLFKSIVHYQICKVKAVKSTPIFNKFVKLYHQKCHSKRCSNC